MRDADARRTAARRPGDHATRPCFHIGKLISLNVRLLRHIEGEVAAMAGTVATSERDTGSVPVIHYDFTRTRHARLPGKVRLPERGVIVRRNDWPALRRARMESTWCEDPSHA
jgi:hypothetical protein